MNLVVYSVKKMYVNIYRFMVEDVSNKEYAFNLRLKVCLESAFECNRDIEILRNLMIRKQTCAFGPEFQIPGKIHVI